MKARKPKAQKRLAASAIRRRAAKRKIINRRPLHKKILLHPVAVFGLLCVGVFLSGLTYNVLASTLISSVIEAPPLKSAATITSPANGSTVTGLPIYVSGACPADSYVKLQLNGSFDGVAWCDSDNTYSIETSLFSGVNNLSVQDYNQTDLAGPASAGIQVIYSPPAAAKSGQAAAGQQSGGGSQPTPEAKPIVLISDFKFKTFSARKNFTWQMVVQGGTPPYSIHVSWGDNSTSDLYFPTDPTFTLNHIFQSPGYYKIVVTSKDATGQAKVMQLAALINDSDGTSPFIAPIASSAGGSKSSGTSINKTAEHLLVVLWPSYIIVALMALSFWLGEKREYVRILRPAHK